MKEIISSLGVVTLYLAVLFAAGWPIAWGLRELFNLSFELTLLNVTGFSIIFLLTVSSVGFTLSEAFTEDNSVGGRIAASLKAAVFVALGIAAFVFFFVPAYSGIVFPYLAVGVGVLVVIGLINGTLFC